MDSIETYQYVLSFKVSVHAVAGCVYVEHCSCNINGYSVHEWEGIWASNIDLLEIRGQVSFGKKVHYDR